MLVWEMAGLGGVRGGGDMWLWFRSGACDIALDGAIQEGLGSVRGWVGGRRSDRVNVGFPFWWVGGWLFVLGLVAMRGVLRDWWAHVCMLHLSLLVLHHFGEYPLCYTAAGNAMARACRLMRRREIVIVVL